MSNEMNNQAAQTMPELPAPVFFAAPSEGYTATQMHQYASDYAAALSQTAGVADATESVCDGCPHLKTEWWRDHLDNDETDSGTSATCTKEGRNITAYWHEGNKRPNWCPMLAAAPAASGGEARRVWQCPACPSSVEYAGKVAPPCPRCDTTTELDPTAKPSPQPPAGASQSSNRNPVTPGLSSESGASVSERARALLAASYRESGDKAQALDVERRIPYVHHAIALRAVEQALTQQRGELPSAKTFASAVWRDWMTNEQADKLGAELHAWLGAHVATTPQPGAEAMRDEPGGITKAELDWLTENEFDLVTRREDIGDDEYAIWWFVVDSRKSTSKHLHTVSGHPLGSPREAIEAAMRGEK